MRFIVESHEGRHGQRWSVRDTARDVLLLPNNYSPNEATFLARTLNGLLPDVPSAPARPALHVVPSHGLTVIQGGRTA